MRHSIRLLAIVLLLLLPYSAWAILSLELTQGVSGAIPIAVVPFATQGETLPQDISAIIGKDLENSGRFKVYGRHMLNEFPSEASRVSTDYFRQLGTDNVVIGKIDIQADGQYQVSFQLLDMLQAKGSTAVLNKQYTVTGQNLRAVAHHISDLVYQHLTGTRGIFSTKLAYVVVKRGGNSPPHYILEVSDQDGYNPRPMLDSSQPIMSPAWSPNGKLIAYVSFENRRASIYLQDVAMGTRHLLSEFPGINGAPAWSPDGRRLALVLSKSGSPNIYLMDIASRHLTQITHDFYINTEPAFSSDGTSLLFTSNRSDGRPQIYQVNLRTLATSRLSFDGDYNARASYTRDGKHVVMIHRVSGIYNIGFLNLDNGTMRVLTPPAVDSASPSMAPNDSMVLYDTVYNGRNVLGMVSSDGRVQLVLPARDGDAQDPAWSPFLT